MGKLLMPATVFESVANQVSQLSQPRTTLRQCASCPYPVRDRAPTGALLQRGLLAQNRSVATEGENMPSLSALTALSTHRPAPASAAVAMRAVGSTTWLRQRSGPRQECQPRQSGDTTKATGTFCASAVSRGGSVVCLCRPTLPARQSMTHRHGIHHDWPRAKGGAPQGGCFL